MISPVVHKRLSPDEVADVHALLERVTVADGTPPLSEHVMLHLPGGGDTDVRHVLVHADGGLVGYAHLDVTDEVEGPSAELAVDPAHRNRGIGRAIAAELLDQSPDGRLRLWAHGELPGAAAMAAAGGFVRSRVLWQMRRSLDIPLPEAALPDGITVRTFVVGQDEQPWTEVNNRAFTEHPDQGGWSVHEVTVREREPWFDPDGFFLAERDGQLVGFHWTKVHGEHLHDGEHPHELLGEVYVVGVDPSEQGRGLGPAMTLVGLHHLQDKGLPSVMLYVDEKNTNAIRVYERLGFNRHATDVCFSRG
ncbi:MAG TPA: mycothiol synthase [Mycobacteriales bacterium]|nr:mycothiol synthase [Mycobacteriales bacterium]